MPTATPTPAAPVAPAATPAPAAVTPTPVAAAPVAPAAPAAAENVLAPDAPAAAPAEAATSVLGEEVAPAKDPATEGDKAKPAETKPEDVKLELKFPEGFEKDEAVLGEFLPLAKELGLKQEGAQKLVDLFAKAQASAQEKIFQGVAEQPKAWLGELKADKEFGGEKFDVTVREARRAIEKFGSPELKAFFRDSGLGNHPMLVKFAAQAGRALAEDSSAGKGSGAAVSNPNSAQARLDRMYPTMKEK